jgi:hypothetical protein
VSHPSSVRLRVIASTAVVLESDDEARHAAEAIIADVASGRVEAAAVFLPLYDTARDLIRIGAHLVPLLTEALKRFTAGDRSPETVRLVALAAAYDEATKTADADRVIAKTERMNERRAAAAAAIQPAPDIADRMTGVGPYGIPIPHDASEPDDRGFMNTRVCDPVELMAFYIERLRADGWTLHLDTANPVGRPDLPPNCFFDRDDLVGRSLSIICAEDMTDPSLTRFVIFDIDP